MLFNFKLFGFWLKFFTIVIAVVSMINFFRNSRLATLLSLFNIGTSHSTANLHNNMAGSVAGSSPVVIKPSDKHTATFIFFHGLGDQGHGWADVAKTSLKSKHIKFVFPNAAYRKVTLNFGMNMPAWYDLTGLTPNAREDDEGIAEATKYAHELMDAEIKAGIPSERIVIGGFSMGGALAVYAGLTYDKKLGAIAGLSSFLLQRNKLPGAHQANLQTPVFLGHGTYDSLVPLSYGQLTSEKIKTFNPKVELHTYPMEHMSCPEELNDLNAFLEKNVPQQ